MCVQKRSIKRGRYTFHPASWAKGGALFFREKKRPLSLCFNPHSLTHLKIAHSIDSGRL